MIIFPTETICWIHARNLSDNKPSIRFALIARVLENVWMLAKHSCCTVSYFISREAGQGSWLAAVKPSIWLRKHPSDKDREDHSPRAHSSGPDAAFAAGHFIKHLEAAHPARRGRHSKPQPGACCHRRFTSWSDGPPETHLSGTCPASLRYHHM
jgi:hypothetical protein